MKKSDRLKIPRLPKGFIRSTKRAVKIVWTCTPVLSLINIFVVVIQSLMPLAALIIMKKIVDTVSSGISAADKNAAFRSVLLWIILAAIIAGITALLTSISVYISEAQSLKVTDHITNLLHTRSVEVDLAFYEDAEYYNTMHRAQKEAPDRPNRIIKNLVEITRGSLSLTGIAVLLFSFNWWIGILLIFAALPSALVKLKFSQRLFGFEGKYTEKDRRAWYYHMVMTDPYHARELRLFNLGSLFISRFRKLRLMLREKKLSISKKKALFEFFAQFLTTIAVFCTFAFICYQTLFGIITLGSMVMYYQGFQRGLSFLRTMLLSLAGLYEDNLFLSYFNNFLDLKPGIITPTHPQKIAATGKIEVNNIEFSYPGSKTPVLSGLSLAIPQGRVVAIVGENGSGKSTLVKLLCRFYDPDRGTINYADSNLKDFDPLTWRKKLSVIFQDYIHYSVSAAENIWFGNIFKQKNPEINIGVDNLEFDKIDAAGIKKAAILSGADDVITNLAQHYNTQLTRIFKDGHELSIGEWQKIALARAFYRNSEIIILDEPTSSIDPIAEAKMFKDFRKLIKGKTAIVISHRFSTVRMADEIIVLHKGKVIEHGSHIQLIKKQGYYAEMYASQAASFNS